MPYIVIEVTMKGWDRAYTTFKLFDKKFDALEHAYEKYLTYAKNPEVPVEMNNTGTYETTKVRWGCKIKIHKIDEYNEWKYTIEH